MAIVNPLKSDEQAAVMHKMVVAHFQRNGLRKADGGFLRDHIYRLRLDFWPDGVHRISTEAPSPLGMQMDYASEAEFYRYWGLWSKGDQPTPAFKAYS
jgi:hypothetical protein